LGAGVFENFSQRIAEKNNGAVTSVYFFNLMLSTVEIEERDHRERNKSKPSVTIWEYTMREK
jgi:hypothetical protein